MLSYERYPFRDGGENQSETEVAAARKYDQR